MTFLLFGRTGAAELRRAECMARYSCRPRVTCGGLLRARPSGRPSGAPSWQRPDRCDCQDDDRQIFVGEALDDGAEPAGAAGVPHARPAFIRVEKPAEAVRHRLSRAPGCPHSASRGPVRQRAVRQPESAPAGDIRSSKAAYSCAAPRPTSRDRSGSSKCRHRRVSRTWRFGRRLTNVPSLRDVPIRAARHGVLAVDERERVLHVQRLEDAPVEKVAERLGAALSRRSVRAPHNRNCCTPNWRRERICPLLLLQQVRTRPGRGSDASGVQLLSISSS